MTIAAQLVVDTKAVPGPDRQQIAHFPSLVVSSALCAKECV